MRLFEARGRHLVAPLRGRPLDLKSIMGDYRRGGNGPFCEVHMGRMIPAAAAGEADRSRRAAQMSTLDSLGSGGGPALLADGDGLTDA